MRLVTQMFLNWNQLQASLYQWKSILQAEADKSPLLLPHDIRIYLRSISGDPEEKLIIHEVHQREDWSLYLHLELIL